MGWWLGTWAQSAGVMVAALQTSPRAPSTSNRHARGDLAIAIIIAAHSPDRAKFAKRLGK